MLVKICGTTTKTDGLLAAHEGADYIGVIVEHPASPRNVSVHTARNIRDSLEEYNCQAQLVAVTVNLPLAQLLVIQEMVEPHILQLHGDEEPECVAELVGRGLRVWASCGEATLTHDPRPRVDALVAAGAEAVIVDSRIQRADGETIYGGTGTTSNWTFARNLSDDGIRVVLSGGLKPGNVAHAVEDARPWLLDAVSGVETHPGMKDEEKIRAFIRNVREAEVTQA